MDTSMFDLNWIWTPEWDGMDDKEPRIVYFRKSFQVDMVPQHCRIQISADSRYKLYVNGCFLQAGPVKGNQEIWYMDEAELSPYLKNGENVIAVEVLRYPEDFKKRNHSLIRTQAPCLYVTDVFTDSRNEAGDAADGVLSVPAFTLNGKNGWKCRINRKIQIVPDPKPPAVLQILENAEGEEECKGWKTASYQDGDWADAKPYTFFQMQQTISPWNLHTCPIPYQETIDKRFCDVVCIREYTKDGEGATEKEIQLIQENLHALLTGEGKLSIGPHSRFVAEISAGELMTGFLKLAVAYGSGCMVTIHCAESYAYPPDENSITHAPVKGNRTDDKNGRLFGCQDHYRVAGYGTDTQPEEYEPYWFRTFRFIQLTVETADEGITLQDFSYRQTGYPLKVRTKVSASDSSLAGIWEISERTLRRCMHETYMDCPFYEQLQYSMDSRSEILFTYAVSADDRLARKCMEDFRKSQRSDGMISQSAPNAKSDVIPGFSIYYILMVHDHMMYFGDRKLVKTHLPAIDRVLQFFDDHLIGEGLVGSIGGPIMRKPYWSFIDWAVQWNETAGVPLAVKKGPITMESLLYILGLMKAAELADFVGRRDSAEEYRSRASHVREAVRNHCMGSISGADGKEHKLVQDGPRVEEYSVHCQVFASLTDVVTPDEGKKMLEDTVGVSGYAQCSVAMSFYLFRALEKVGWYEKTNDIWELWRKMLDDHLTTCVENDTDARSDCHAWGAAVLYELPAVVLGVHPSAPGFTSVDLNPQMGYLTESSGDVITPKGMAHVEWRRMNNGECQVSYKFPEGIEVIQRK